VRLIENTGSSALKLYRHRRQNRNIVIKEVVSKNFEHFWSLNQEKLMFEMQSDKYFLTLVNEATIQKKMTNSNIVSL